MTAERLGILGGTFDPPHVGHLSLAVDVRHHLHLDRMLLVVANDPWQKRGSRPISPAAVRLAMVQAAVADLDGVEADDREIRRGGPSYTADTLAELASESPGCRLFTVVGEDAAAGIHSWERVGDVQRLSTLVVVDRPRAAPAPDPEGFQVLRVATPPLDISSTDLRARFADGRPVEVLVPRGAVAIARREGLYAGAR